MAKCLDELGEYARFCVHLVHWRGIEQTLSPREQLEVLLRAMQEPVNAQL